MNLFCSAVNTFDDIYLSVHMPVVIFDLQAIIVKANPAFLDLVKAGSESYQSLVVTSFFQNYINDIDVFKNISEHTVVEITDAEGSTIPIIFHYNELKDIRGNLQGGMLFITDVRDLFLPPTSRPAFDQFPGKDPQTIKIPDQLLQEKKKLEQEAINKAWGKGESKNIKPKHAEIVPDNCPYCKKSLYYNNFTVKWECSYCGKYKS